MRASILLQSALSGAVMGLLVSAALLGVGIVLWAVVPALGRLPTRLVAILATLALALPILAGAVLGWLEGRLKLPS